MAWRDTLREGVVIPAHPLALTSDRKLDERRQRALTRYYLESGAGGIAVGVHTTQFEIRSHGLLKPVLELAIEESTRFAELSTRRQSPDLAPQPGQSQSPHLPPQPGRRQSPQLPPQPDQRQSTHLADLSANPGGTGDSPVQTRVAGIVGRTPQAVAEAEQAAALGYHVGLLSLAALSTATIPELLDHARAVAQIIPVMGFYLQPAVGGRVLPYEFWRAFAEIENVVAIKMAPFNRYQTLDVIRAVAESGRAGDIALYTGNDDNILVDLHTPFRFGATTLRIVGGLLGHWAVWTGRAVEQLAVAKTSLPDLTLAAEITDANAAFFDAANAFHGCIAGIHEVLRRQGLLAGRWCLDPGEDLSPGQMEEIDRVYRAYPHLNDDAFVVENLDRWMR